uniref:Alpha-galactosidase n=1 Tax=Plectus sambesii TaxID=2011161 RepID=A0A914XH85_9BILA
MKCLDNGLALTPPMGWLSWTRFMCQTDCVKYPKHCISEDLFLEMADVLVKEGYQAAGYNRVNIDDCWMTKTRDKNGRLIADPVRFSHGISWLADQIHKRGLLMGIYSNFGQRTCMGFAGTDLNNIETDALTYAEFNADYLKFDGCFQPENRLNQAYPKMGESLNRTGRPMVYSCSWPYYILTVAKRQPDYPSVVKHCNLWRNYDDIQISWPSVLSIIDFYDANQDMFAKFHGPGHWNDPDMIIVGNQGLTSDQALVQMALWCLWSAPLLMSNDLREMMPGTREILLNKRLIAVDQDPLGIMGKRFKQDNDIGYYRKPVTPLVNGKHSFVFVAFNRAATKTSVTLDFALLGLEEALIYDVVDLVSGEQLNRLTIADTINLEIRATSVAVLKATPLLLKTNAQRDGDEKSSITIFPYIIAILALVFYLLAFRPKR